MEATENKVQYKISNHAAERYAQRIMGKDEKSDIKRFITLNEDKITTDINKMIEYGSLLYTGKQSQKDGKGKVVDVYLKDTWVILVDEQSRNIITLYKIDLGLDDDFNKAYVAKMMEKLNSNKEVLESVQQQVQAESDMYRQMIDEAECQIKEYRSMIKNLEELSAAYTDIISNNIIKVTQANKNVADVLNQLLGKKEF